MTGGMVGDARKRLAEQQTRAGDTIHDIAVQYDEQWPADTRNDAAILARAYLQVRGELEATRTLHAVLVEQIQPTIRRHMGSAWNGEQTRCCGAWRWNRDHARHAAKEVATALLPTPDDPRTDPKEATDE